MKNRPNPQRLIGQRLVDDQPAGGLQGMTDWCSGNCVAYPRDCWNPSGSFRCWLFEDGSAVRFSDMTDRWISVLVDPKDPIVKGSPVPR